MTDIHRNNDYPPISVRPRNPPPFPPETYESCDRITSRVLTTDNEVRIYDQLILVKTGNELTSLTVAEDEDEENEGGGDDDDDEDDEDSEYSSYYGDDSDNSSYSSRDSNDSNEPSSSPTIERAYLLDRKIRDAIFGEVRSGIILTRSNPNDHMWRMTNERCAIKIMSREMMRYGRNQNIVEEPERENAAMQFLFDHHQGHLQEAIGNNDDADDSGDDNNSPENRKQIMYRTNTIMQLDALYDETYFYNIMPFINGGEIFNILKNQVTFLEEEARFVMKQILHGLKWLKRAGTFHRDICLENLMMDQKGRVFIIDMGMCIQMPFVDGERVLISPLDQSAREYMLAPEVFNNIQETPSPFDGCTVDLWSVGVLLFILLTGFQPWDTPNETDERFRQISGGHLARVLSHWNIPISEDAVDLLQMMLYRQPLSRLSLDDVSAHRWMNGLTQNPMIGEDELRQD